MYPVYCILFSVHGASCTASPVQQVLIQELGRSIKLAWLRPLSLPFFHPSPFWSSERFRAPESRISLDGTKIFTFCAGGCVAVGVTPPPPSFPPRDIFLLSPPDLVLSGCSRSPTQPLPRESHFASLATTHPSSSVKNKIHQSSYFGTSCRLVRHPSFASLGGC